MCGIVGLFLKDPSREAMLGGLLTPMLESMTERGPDSAGFAVYRRPVADKRLKYSLFSDNPSYDWAALAAEATQRFSTAADADRRASHAVLTVAKDAASVRAWLDEAHPDLRLMGFGERIEIFKEKGLPSEVSDRFHLSHLDGSHAVCHTRMATESAVTTEHSHPFATGGDLCLVHNGSLSNHNRLRSWLRRRGVRFDTDNDSEVAAGYLTWRMSEGMGLDEALTAAIDDLDGFYTFAVGTRDGFAVLRDPIACKPAVLAETGDWVAMASEFRAIATLPGSETAEIWEPEPGKVYHWSRA